MIDPFDLRLQARTLYYRDNNSPQAVVFTTGLVLKIAILVVETVEKRRLLKSPYSAYPPEALGGIVNRSVFWWLNSLLLKGSSSRLQMDHLFDLDQELLSEKLDKSFRLTWTASRKRSPYSLLWTVVRCARKPMFASVAARLVLIAFKFSQPLLIDRAVSLLTEPESEYRINTGRTLIGATALVYLGIALATGHFSHNTYRFITIFRGGLIGLVYSKTLDLDTSQAGDAAAITLMSTDIDRIAAGFELFAALWAGPIEIAIGIYLLYLRLGVSCVVSIILALLFIMACLAMGRLSATAKKDWLAAVQRRVAATSSALSNMKGIKMTGLSQIVESTIQNLRMDELHASKRFRWLLSATATISNMSMLTIATITITTYILVGRGDGNARFDPALAFTSISLISLIANPVQEISVAIPQMAAAIGCFQRIQTYLLAPSLRKDNHYDSESILPPPSESAYELSDLLSVISVRGAHFTFKIASEPVLHDIDLVLPPKSWTVLLGPVGSGKSALILALLGELVRTRGVVHRDVGFEIAYCAQEPWLPNLTIRQVMMGSSDIDQQWYSSVVHACALDRDCEELPHGEENLVGSNGSSLSGGQKQRISLARSLYSRKRLLLLDDVLSGLDPTTEQLIVKLRHIRQADYAIVMSPDGRIAEQGMPHQVSFLQKQQDEDRNAVASSPSPDAIAIEQPNRSQHRLSMELQQEELQQDLSRQSGDIRLYGYYLEAMGWLNAVGFAVSDGIFAFCVTFPTLWLKWWSEEEAVGPGSRMTMYMAVYGMFSLVGILSFFTKFYLRTSRQLRLLELEAKSPLYSHFSESLSGLATVRAFVWQKPLTDKMHGLLNESQKPFYLLWSIQRWLNFVLDCIVAIVACVIMTLATQTGDLSAGLLGVALVNILTFSQNLTSLIRVWVDLETSLGAVARVRSFEMDTPCEKLPQERAIPPTDWPADGEIQWRDVSASYRPGGELVLQGLSFAIQKGSKVGICGRTGSGKSSFLLALLRLVEVEHGDISVDGLSLIDIPRALIRRRLTVMPQDPLLLTGTVRFSIDPWHESSDDTIELALRKVGLWDIILARGGIGIDMDVCPISRGQQQLLCLAHALLSKSQILILDEATSNLDEGSQTKIMQLIEESFASRTVLVVAHHLHTLRNFDQIIVLDRGRLVGSGTPDELMSRPGRFRALWNSQSN
ncbi:hypothetical protein FSARC_12927 [Fusarium sarcochroum]|uniref:ABC transporter n=1 Tax=Fusarium sarcochroum TaxID=1208366 RepID=A0A8H4T4V5_9HYPO|nr:hypothetical protein FSARC_12927 [Fusarium sarcochroum]